MPEGIQVTKPDINWVMVFEWIHKNIILEVVYPKFERRGGQRFSMMVGIFSFADYVVKY
jgi:hypothetical protein